MYVRTGMVHLLNTITGEFTPSERVFDTIRGGVGGFLEENVEKLLKKHDRRPGKFKENSELKQVFEDYQKNKVSFEDLCYEIGERLYDKKGVMEIHEESTLFILDGGFDGQNLIIGLEIQRRPGYVIENGVSDGKGVNRVYANQLIIPPIRQKNCRLFTVDINTLEVSTLEMLTKEEFYLFEEDLLQAEMDHSLNWYVDDARQSFYAALRGVTLAESEGIVSLSMLKSEKEVTCVNAFEKKMNTAIKKYRLVNFDRIAREILGYDPKLEQCFTTNLEGYSVPRKVIALSNAPLKLKTLEYRPKRVRLRSGIEVLVPDEVTEIDEQIKLKEVDGRLTEVENNEEV